MLLYGDFACNPATLFLPFALLSWYHGHNYISVMYKNYLPMSMQRAYDTHPQRASFVCKSRAGAPTCVCAAACLYLWLHPRSPIPPTQSPMTEYLQRLPRTKTHVLTHTRTHAHADHHCRSSGVRKGHAVRVHCREIWRCPHLDWGCSPRRG